MKLLKKYIFLIASIFLATASWKKHGDCYDAKLYRQHKGEACTMDCPGVIGCDGKTYCNECEANRQGIRIN